jgi:hypothetical protein
MCIILTGPSNEMRSTLLGTAGLIESIYKYNSDGLGLMYRNKRGMKIVKTLPRSVEDFRRVVEQMPDDNRSMALHARLTTHGDTDTTNCHPYVVVPGQVALMHNGILDTGNDADKTKSDTWHFCKDFLEGPVSKYPELIHDEGFRRMLAEFIGNNRFVFMDSDGVLSVINEDQGIKHGALWFANTYAWDPALLIKGYKSRSSYWSHGSTALTAHTARRDYEATWEGFDNDAYESWKVDRNQGPQWNQAREAEFIEAVMMGDVEDVSDMLDDFGAEALDALFSRFIVTENKYTDDLVGNMKAIMDAFVTQSMPTLKGHCKQRPEAVAEVLCYYADLVDLVPQEEEPEDPDYLYREVQDDTGASTTWYKRHCITVSEDEPGSWGYTIEDVEEVIAYAGVGYGSAELARRDAIRWIDQYATEEV